MTNTLERMLPEAKKKHTNSFSPAHSQIYIPVQTRFIDVPPSPSEMGTSMGRFYEFLSIALYGGKPNDVKFNVRLIDYFGGSKPDVRDNTARVISECKSSSYSRSCNLMNRQTLGNIFQQVELPDFNFRYIFYKSSLNGIKTTYKGNEDQLFSDLSKRTVFSVILPFDVILTLSDPANLNEHRLVRHYEGRDYPNCTCINSSTVDGFLIDVGGTLKKAGLDPEEYRIRRYISPNVKLNGIAMVRFPIVRVDRKNVAKWRMQFIRDFKDRKYLGLMQYLSKKSKDDETYPPFWDEV